MRKYLLIGIVWVASLVAVGMAASAQAPFFQPLPTPRVVEAPDVGFQVTGMAGDVPMGHIVIRMNGRWVEARIGGLEVRRIR